MVVPLCIIYDAYDYSPQSSSRNFANIRNPLIYCVNRCSHERGLKLSLISVQDERRLALASLY